MKRLTLQMFAVAIALIVTGTQRQAQCAVEVNGMSVPPCHRHESSQEPCKHLALVSDNPAPTFDFSADKVELPPLRV